MPHAKILFPDDPDIANFYRGQDIRSYGTTLFPERDNLLLEIEEVAGDYRSPDRLCKSAILYLTVDISTEKSPLMGFAVCAPTTLWT